MAKDAHGTDLHVGDLVHVPYTIADIRETHEHAYVTLTAPPHGLPTAPSGVIVLSTHVLKDLPVTPMPPPPAVGHESKPSGASSPVPASTPEPFAAPTPAPSADLSAEPKAGRSRSHRRPRSR